MSSQPPKLTATFEQWARDSRLWQLCAASCHDTGPATVMRRLWVQAHDLMALGCRLLRPWSLLGALSVAGCLLFRLTVAARPLERSLPLSKRFWWLVQSQYAQAQAAVQQQQVCTSAPALIYNIHSSAQQDGKLAAMDVLPRSLH